MNEDFIALPDDDDEVREITVENVSFRHKNAHDPRSHEKENFWIKNSDDIPTEPRISNDFRDRFQPREPKHFNDPTKAVSVCLFK